MSDTSQANKRIAKNTLVIYGQLILKVFLGLFTSRLALEALGVSDFGLFCVVGGVVGLFTIISSSLAYTTIRFINLERGKPDGDLNMIFNVCNVLHIFMAVLLFLLFEVIGVYYIHHYLNVPSSREFDAMFVFQVSTIMCCLSIINVPFASLFNATEKFFFTSFVDILAKLIRLFLLIWLLTYDGNRLRVYALIETVFYLIPFIAFHFYSYRLWPEVVKWRLVKISKVYKDILLFSYYNFISTFAYSCRGQGSILLINYFFGTMVNGAYGVAKTMERNIWPFANNFQSAAAPQITQSYSRGDMDRVFYLTTRISKYCMLMMALVLFPLWAELDYILHLWLVKVPEGALVFCQVTIFILILSITDAGIGYVVNASKHYSIFKTVYFVLTILCIPIGYVILKLGFSAYMMLVTFLIADFIYRIAQLYMMHSILNFPVRIFCFRTYLPVVEACLPAVICLLLTSRIELNSPLWHVSHVVLVFLVIAFSVYYIGLQKLERKKILSHILRRIKFFNYR